MTSAFAIAAAALLLGLAGFQAQLAAGRPLGRFAWGGAHEVLPFALRIASTFAIALYVAIAIVLLDAAGVVDALGDWTGTAAWALAGYFLVGVAMNGASRSRDERRVMTPLALVLSLLCTGVAVGA